MLAQVGAMDGNTDSVTSITCSTLLPMLVIGMLMCYWHYSNMFSEDTHSHNKQAHGVRPERIEINSIYI